MQIKKGKNRTVYIFPLLKICFKLPRIYLLKTFCLLFNCIKRREWKRIIIEIKRPADKKVMGPRRYLFKGILDNLREFYFYFKTRHPFLIPTYFSFFGFLNIQKLGDSCETKGNDLYCQLYELTDQEAMKDIHHFDNDRNFSLINGKLKALDYGEPETQKIILKYGIKIHQEFDPDYSWEEKKKELREEKIN